MGVVEMLSVNTIVYKMGDRMLRGGVRQGAAGLEAGHGEARLRYHRDVDP